MANMRTWALVGLLVLGAAAPSLAQYGDEGYGDEGGEGYGGGGGGGGGYGGDGDDYGGGGGYGGDGGGGGNYNDPDTKIAGVLDLDVNTFDKVIDGRHHAFVFLYEAYEDTSKDFVEELETIATELAAHKSLVLAKVNAEDLPELKEKYGVEELPGLVYLAKGSMAVERFEGETKTAEFVLPWITDKTGEVGTVEALKTIVNKIMDDKAGRAAAKTQLSAVVAKLEGFDAGYGAYYIKVADKVSSKGDEFVKAEFERLQRMVVSGSLRTEKEAEFKLRCAVLKVFSREKLENLKPVEEDEDEDEEEKEEL